MAPSALPPTSPATAPRDSSTLAASAPYREADIPVCHSPTPLSIPQLAKQLPIFGSPWPTHHRCTRRRHVIIDHNHVAIVLRHRSQHHRPTPRLFSRRFLRQQRIVRRIQITCLISRRSFLVA